MSFSCIVLTTNIARLTSYAANTCLPGKNIIKIILLFISFNTHAINWVQDHHHHWYVGEIPIHSNASYANNNDSTDRYRDYEMRHHHESQYASNYNNSSSWHTGTSNSTDSSSSSGEYDHFKEFSIEQAREMIEQNREDRNNIHTSSRVRILRELEVRHGQAHKNMPWNSELILKNICTLNDLLTALSDPIVKARFERLKYEYAKKRCKTKELAFLDAILSEKIAPLLTQLKSDNPAIAQAAFITLKNIWPWDNKYGFLHPKRSIGESKFISKLGIDIMKIAEINVITHQIFIEKYTNKASLEAISQHKTQCSFLQQNGDKRSLAQQIQRLEKIVKKNGKKINLIHNIQLAIAQKTLADPITTTFNKIIYATSIQDAGAELVRFRTHVLERAQQENISSDHIQEWIINTYGYDIVQALSDRYKSRVDYIDSPVHQAVLSELSECLSPILYNIQNLPLPQAYNELMHCDSHVSSILAQENITDPAAQTEYLIKNFDVNVRKVTHGVYEYRADHQYLCKNYSPLNVANITTAILKTSDNYALTANLFGKLSEQIMNNAQLCQLDNIPQIQDTLTQSLQVIRQPKNPAEFIVHVTIMDQVLTDIQYKTDAVVTGKPTLWERSPDLLLRTLVSFISRLDPVTQIKDVGSLFTEGSKLVDSAANIIAERIIEEIHDPIGTTQEYCNSAVLACEYLINTARFTSDAIAGVYYLSPEERSQRIQMYGKKAEDIYNNIESKIEAEQVAEATGTILGDIVFYYGLSTVGTLLKEIDAIGKISQEAKAVTQSIKNAAVKHPELATTEGLALKMSHEAKDAASKIKNTTPPTQSIAKDITKSAGDIMRENGKAFEDFLVKELGGRGSFKAGRREFDGAIGNIWYEAKSGKYWENLLMSEKKLNDFQSTTCDCLKIARDNGALFEVHSNAPIPQSIKDWLTQKQIKFREWL